MRSPRQRERPQATGELLIGNRQKTRAVNRVHLRKCILAVLGSLADLRQFELGIHLVDAREMAAVNEQFLQHTGSTDVITFDYSALPGGGSRQGKLHGEIFICLDDAVQQARQFKTSWQAELARYVIHGILHLRGFDDLEVSKRRRMKREESRLLRWLGARLPWRELERRKRKAGRISF